MKREAISVAMCVYGGDDPEHFHKAIQSVAEQTVKPDEIVIIVDGPVPAGIDDVLSYWKMNADGIHFRVVRFKDNRGHGEARRASIRYASNELIALMDADDLSVPDRFEKQLAYFEKHPELTAVGGMITEFIGTPDNRVGRRTVPNGHDDILRFMKKRCPMNQVTVMFRKSDVRKVGGYRDWYCDEDYYLWIRLALAGYRFGNLEDDLVNVRVGKEMYGRRGGLKYFRSESKLQVLMFRRKMIGPVRCLINISERLILQVLMPGKLRGFVFQKLAREH